MGKHTSNEFKTFIISLFQKGKKPKEISSDTSMPFTTIYNIISGYKKNKNKIQNEKRGRNSILTKREKI